MLLLCSSLLCVGSSFLRVGSSLLRVGSSFLRTTQTVSTLEILQLLFVHRTTCWIVLRRIELRLQCVTGRVTEVIRQVRAFTKSPDRELSRIDRGVHHLSHVCSCDNRLLAERRVHGAQCTEHRVEVLRIAFMVLDEIWIVVKHRSKIACLCGCIVDLRDAQSSSSDSNTDECVDAGTHGLFCCTTW